MPLPHRLRSTPIPAVPESPPTVLPRPLYGLVAWPCSTLDRWLRQQQQRLGVRAFGEPHLNLRAPFSAEPSEAALVDSLRSLLAQTQPFEVEVGGWRVFPGTVFLECHLSPELLALHDHVLTLPGAPPQPYDQKEYIPHLTLALGVLPWARDALNSELLQLTPPVSRFTVSALSLTREGGGEVREIHTFPLGKE
ncbi:2'-5' RNA ligase family protein [Deinococcus ruber]|uniref:2'-5' RNA ligase family protein n=1 Tax=Deinococcus ruber TaxID=1848197 RepID=UPI001E50443B|nr:2'-5' RNA ligase family protein [Deinococcus ruber]